MGICASTLHSRGNVTTCLRHWSGHSHAWYLSHRVEVPRRRNIPSTSIATRNAFIEEVQGYLYCCRPSMKSDSYSNGRDGTCQDTESLGAGRESLFFSLNGKMTISGEARARSIRRIARGRSCDAASRAIRRTSGTIAGSNKALRRPGVRPTLPDYRCTFILARRFLINSLWVRKNSSRRP